MDRSLALALVLLTAPGCSFDSTGQSGAPDASGATGGTGAVTDASATTDATTGSATTNDVTTSAATMSGSTSDTTEPGTSGSTGVPASCGDGKIDPLEECDLGRMNGPGKTCKSDCTSNVCGDGDVGPGESCDDGNLADGDGCSMQCAPESCGNSKVDAGEQCDDGNTMNEDGCTNACTLPICGDMFVQAGEQCDVGGESAACDADCTGVVCGDGTLNTSAGEACDDGNMTDTDACVSCQPAACGDGFVQAGVETCDDKNTNNGDGCSATCQAEPLRVFVSSTTYKGDLGGLTGADDTCQGIAEKTGLGGTWMAWLSDDTVGPADRFITKGGNRPYVLLNMMKIADDWADLVDGSLDTQLNRTEMNTAGAGSNSVWTNTGVDGHPSSTMNTCVKWTDGTGSPNGNYGERNQSDMRWTNKGANSCSNTFHIYCFEQ